MFYEVRLPVFQGPLDLLLRLIEAGQLDITTVSLAQVADQYLEHVLAMEDADPEVVVDFLVVAAKLLLIKSQVLLPRTLAAPEGAREAGEELVQRLAEYRRFKAAAEGLRVLEEMGQRSHRRLAPWPAPAPPAPVGAGCAPDLVDAWRRLLTRQAAQAPPVAVPQAAYSLAEKMAAIDRVLSAQAATTFRQLARGARWPAEVVALFLALLELWRRGRIAVEQPSLFGDILLSRPPPGPQQPEPQGGPQSV